MPARKLFGVAGVVLAALCFGAPPASAASPIPALTSVGVGRVTVSNLFAHSATVFDGVLTTTTGIYVGEFTIDGFVSIGAPPPVPIHGTSPTGSNLSGICALQYTPDGIDRTFVNSLTAVVLGWEVFQCFGHIDNAPDARFTIHLDVVRVPLLTTDGVQEVGAYHTSW